MSPSARLFFRTSCRTISQTHSVKALSPKPASYKATPLQRRSFTGTTAAMGAQQTTKLTSHDLIDILANRRSYYSLKASSPISDAKIKEIISEVMLKVPSAFNLQTVRVVVALNDAHRQVWDTAGNALKAKIGEQRYNEGTKPKFDAFRGAYGTVLFYTDATASDDMKTKAPSYKAQFDPWNEHTQGMHQLTAWAALEAEGLGANLQHYNPVIDADLVKLFNIPEHWELRAQLVFGEIEGDRPAEKDKKPLEETVKVFGAQ